MLRKQVSQNRPGLTFIELLISIAVIGVVVVVIVAVLASQNSSFREEAIRNRLTTDETQTLNDIQYNLISGSQIEASYTYDSTVYTTDSDTIVIAMPTIDATGGLVANSSDMYIVTRETGTTDIHVLLIPDASSGRQAQNKIAIQNATDFIIRYDNEDPTLSTLFSVTLQVSKQTSANRLIESTQTMTYDLRNA